MQACTSLDASEPKLYMLRICQDGQGSYAMAFTHAGQFRLMDYEEIEMEIAFNRNAHPSRHHLAVLTEQIRPQRHGLVFLDPQRSICGRISCFKFAGGYAAPFSLFYLIFTCMVLGFSPRRIAMV
ncbi:MAG: hypothetical protein H6Q48_978 [Deltaproteobacteria bacterium]|jgi:hypothetical protein|nr:hypothetical protein [Deltaproteobacteria bacterium]